ncbi:MAG: AMP-binding protein [Candidatus Gastranaerophilaceae bacterium]
MDKTNNILLFLENRTELLDDEIALGMKSNLGWSELTFRGLGILSRRLANYLIKIGVEKGDKLAILSESMPEWGAAFFASVLAGSITIPLDIKLTIYELTSILNNCRPKVLIVSNAYLPTALKLKETIDSIEHIIILDDSGSNTLYPSLYNIPHEQDNKWRHRAKSKTALIIYTSGTTGDPKGVEISFKNVMAQVDSVGRCFNFGIKDNFLSILPMNHLLELTVGFLTFLSKGTSIYYSQSLKPKDLFAIIREKKITFMLAVPAFLKLLKSSIEAEINRLSPVKKLLFKINYKIAKFIPFYSIKKMLFSNIHKKIGNDFKGCLIGGAPIEPSVGEFFETIGIIVIEGYGLSEASPVVASNTFKKRKLGSVGNPIPNVEVKIDKNTGELLVKGDNVMKGYYNKPELTAEVVDEDGWLHTGDIARIDKGGFVYITGRIKSMIVLSGGKKVFPEEVETVLEKNPKFAEVCVFGAKRSGGQKDGTEDVFVAIVPSQDVLDVAKDEKELNKIIREEVKIFSERLSPYKRPTNIIIAQGPFPRTSTRKVKRNEVKKSLLRVS